MSTGFELTMTGPKKCGYVFTILNTRTITFILEVIGNTASLAGAEECLSGGIHYQKGHFEYSQNTMVAA